MLYALVYHPLLEEVTLELGPIISRNSGWEPTSGKYQHEAFSNDLSCGGTEGNCFWPTCVARSTAVSRYLNPPTAVGKGPTKSTDMFSKGMQDDSLVCIGLCLGLDLSCFWHISHCLIWSMQSRLMDG